MDDFREWLSDNLRYFMLGGGVLLILLVLIFGIKACAGGKSSDATSQVQQTTTTQSETTTTNSESTQAETTTTKTENPLTDASAEVTSLIQSYYTALGNKDVDAVKAIEINLAPEDESKITNAQDYITGYQVNKVYTKNGMESGTYVAYAVFQYLCKDISTPVPALSQFYVVTDTDGNLKINGGAASDASISAYMNTLRQESDVKALTAQVKADNDKALADDPALAEFLGGLGEDSSSSSSDQTEKEGTTYTTTTYVNVRSSTNDGDILTTYDYGTSVQVLSFDGEWAQISYDGGTAYIYGEYLEKAE